MIVNPRLRQAALGPVLRQAWVGYRRRLEQELAAAGFDDHRLPDGRVLRICSSAEEPSVAHIGRELGITRQGAAKLVAGLRERGYVTVSASATNGREKIVALTPRAADYLAAHRKATRRIEAALRREIGNEAFDGLYRLHRALGGDHQPRLRDYLQGTDALE